MARLSLDDSDKQVRDWFMTYAKSLGCKTFYDQMGNLFAIRPGKNNDVPPIMMGSHLDTQPTGGRYDGILGVVSGLEVLRTLNDNGWETEGPVGVVNWTKYVSLVSVQIHLLMSLAARRVLDSPRWLSHQASGLT